MNGGHSFLLGRPDGEETTRHPPQPQSDLEEVSHGGVAGEELTTEPDQQAGGECKAQGRKAIEKPGRSRVHIREMETLVSNHKNFNSQGKQLDGA